MILSWQKPVILQCVGLSLMGVELTASQAFPNAPQELWEALFWLSITTLTISLLWGLVPAFAPPIKSSLRGWLDIKEPTLIESPQRQPAMVDFERPNYILSDQRDRFTLVEAACLWADVSLNPDPVALSLIPEAYTGYMILCEAVEGGDLPCHTSHSPPRLTKSPEPAWRVFRKDLLVLAEKKGVKPWFLYPEQRNWMGWL